MPGFLRGLGAGTKQGIGHKAMNEFIFSVLVFTLAHIIPPSPPVRTRLIALMGRRIYLLAYSLLSIALLTWMIMAAQRAPHIELWGEAPWQSQVTIFIMPLAIWLLLGGLFEPNVLSISLRKKDMATPLGLPARVTRHPVLWGFLLWALTHLLPNGDVVSLVLFGGMALLAVFGFFIVDRRTRKRLGAQNWQALAAKTSIVPFAALFSGRAKPVFSLHSCLWVGISLLCYFWILFYAHSTYLGPSPLASAGM